MADGNAIYKRIIEVLQFVTSFQEYVLRKYSGTGLVAQFPSVLVHPMPTGKVGHHIDDVDNVFHLYPYGTTKTEAMAYVNMYVGQLESDLILKKGVVVQLTRFEISNVWRGYIDQIFSQLVRLASQ